MHEDEDVLQTQPVLVLGAYNTSVTSCLLYLGFMYEPRWRAAVMQMLCAQLSWFAPHYARANPAVAGRAGGRVRTRDV